VGIPYPARGGGAGGEPESAQKRILVFRPDYQETERFARELQKTEDRIIGRKGYVWI